MSAVVPLLMACRAHHGDGSGGREAPPTIIEPADSGGSGPTSDSGYRHPDVYTAVDVETVQGCGVVSDGTLRCWGTEDWVRLVPGFRTIITQLSVGFLTKCTVSDSGQVECWCDLPGDAGLVCGVEPPETDFVRVETNGMAGCAQHDDGTLRCFAGSNKSSVRGAPRRPLLDFTVGDRMACGILLDGTPTCWGDTYWFNPQEIGDGEFGLGEAPPLDLTYTAIAVGDRHGCALDTDVEAHCWGTDWYEQDFPDAPPGPFVSLAANDSVSCGLHPDGVAECWGTTPLAGPPHDPRPLTQLEVPDERFSSSAVGTEDNACGVTLDGRIVCWGAYDEQNELIPPLY